MSIGVLYITWGTKYQKLLDRSIRSVRKFYPDIPVEVLRPDASQGFLNKPECIANHKSWDQTLFLDADTVVLGNLDSVFIAAKDHGLACCHCNNPWLRRYDTDIKHRDMLEYSTGMICWDRDKLFALLNNDLMSKWLELSKEPQPPSKWQCGEEVKGLPVEDQYSFSKAIRGRHFNPYVLPQNYNFVPEFNLRFFSPIKIWHSMLDVPPMLETHSQEIEAGKRLVTFCVLSGD